MSDAILDRIHALRDSLSEVRRRVADVALAASGLHNVEGQPLALDVLMLGANIAGGLSLVEAGLLTQMSLLERCAAGRAGVVEQAEDAAKSEQN